MVALVCVLVTSCTGSACASTVGGVAGTAELTISAVEPGSVTLSWGSSLGSAAHGYGVYRGPADADDADLSLIATTDDAVSYTATGLRSGYAYKFGVAALENANSHPEMLTATVSTPKTSDSEPPRPPSSSSVLLTAFSDSRIDLVWAASPSSDIASYQVRRDGNLIATVERPNPQRYSDNGLKPSTLHTYTIVAVDSAGNRSTPTVAKAAQTLSRNEIGIRRGPYVSNVTGTSALVSWWSNIAAPGSVSVAGRSMKDPQGALQHHTVTVTGLQPGTLYPYAVASGNDSRKGSFRTAAPAGRTFSFAAVGDFGSGNRAEAETAAGIASADTEFIQTVGDNIYPSAGLPDPDFTTTLSDFDTRLYRPLAPVLQSQAFFPANGNKEYYSGGAFWSNFPMPGANHSWYGYNWGDAHILVLDTEQPFDPGSEQYKYVRADLAAHQKEAWRIVAMQRPPYSSTSTNSSSDKAQQFLIPLFQTFRVSLVLAGNSHNYERTFPLIDGRPVQGDGITYIVTGAGGNLFTPFTMAKPAYSAFREDTSHEFLKVTVGPTKLVAQTISDAGRSVLDMTTIKPRIGDTKPPSMPTGLVTERPTPSAVYLHWKPSADNVGVAGYRIFRNGTDTPIATVADATFTETDLDPAVSYTYSVRAVDAAGNLSPSSAASVAAPPSPVISDLNNNHGGASPAVPTHPEQQTASGRGCASGGVPPTPAAADQIAPNTFAFRRRPRPNSALCACPVTI